MSEQPSTIYETIVSYIPGMGGAQTEPQNAGGVNVSAGNQGAGHNESTERGQETKVGDTSNTGTGTDIGTGHQNTGSGFQFGQHNTGSGIGHHNAGGSDTGTGSYTGGSTGSEHSNRAGSTGTYSQGGGSTGSGHTGVSDGSGSFQRDDGVRGAPIEGENLKGYAIGAPVGSGDTANPNAPNDPTGQVSGSHLEYGPVHTDNRNQSGRGTHETTKGEGDSSFANVRRDDGHGNSEHVVTKSSKSHMSSTSTTQL